MFRTLITTALLACTAALPSLAGAHEADGDVARGLDTLWEALWHQSGTPTRIVRWDSEMRVRLTGVDLAQHRDTVFTALRAVTEETGVRVVDVSADPAAEPNVKIEVVPDTALEDNQPCVTWLDFRTETRIDSGTMQMRSRDVGRCAHHEAMHLMGVRGHPAGRTVLSYFPVRTDALLPLDKVMLRAWYSPRMKGGMTPFEALPVLADALVASLPADEQPAARQQRDRFFAQTMDQMQAYAAGKGDIPAIIRRSGKSTDEGVRRGRGEMSYFLGVAYVEGATVPADPKAALQWFERAASAGNRRAQTWLAGPK